MSHGRQLDAMQFERLMRVQLYGFIQVSLLLVHSLPSCLRNSASSLRVRYDMCSTDTASATRCPVLRYEMSGTDTASATRCLVLRFEMSGTEIRDV
eukprot:3327697-Rhodomonas_salina.1